MSFIFFVIYLILTYVRPYELFPGLAPLRLMLVIGLAGLLVNLASLPLTQFSFKAKQLPIVFGLALWIAMSRMFALHWLGGAMEALNAFSITLVVFFLTVFAVNTENRLRLALMLIVGLTLFLVVQAVLAVHFGVFRDLLVMEEAQASGAMLSRARGTGFMRDPNDLAQSLVIAIPFLALGWRRGAVPRNVLLVIAPLAVLLYGVYLTHSRGAIISLLVILFVGMRSKLGPGISTLAVVGGALAMIAIMLGGRGLGMDQSAINRLEAWSVGLQLLKQHPLSGVGYGMFMDFNELTAHNSFVLCFAELGLPGYFLWITMLVTTVVELNAIRKLPVKTESDRRLHRYARSIQIAFYAFLVSAWFLSRTYVVTLYLLVGLGIAAVELARRAGKPVGSFAVPTLATRAVFAMAASVILVYLQVRFSVR